MAAAVAKAEAAQERAEADAAAAADSQDVCQGCGLRIGEDAEKDVFWVGCDTCGRWYHGECEGLRADQADEVAAQDVYSCRCVSADYHAACVSLMLKQLLRVRAMAVAEDWGGCGEGCVLGRV